MEIAEFLSLFVCPFTLKNNRQKSRLYRQSPTQTEKFQSKGTDNAGNWWIVPETRFTEFPALSIDPRVKISRSASVPDD